MLYPSGQPTLGFAHEPAGQLPPWPYVYLPVALAFWHITPLPNGFR